MVAASRFARQGVPVTLVNGTGNWGGHFCRMKVGEQWFDPGMVTYEFTSFSGQVGLRDIASYNPAIRSDVGRFCDVVKDFVAGYHKTRTVETPTMVIGGRTFEDLIITNRLNSLRELPIAGRMASELASLATPAPLHASRKRLPGAYDRLDLETASRANHGDAFHELGIEPFCRKLLNVSSREVLARYHRVAWLPLFHPETMLSYLRDEARPLPSTEFSYPIQGHVGDLADQIRGELVSSPHVRIVAERPARITLDGGVQTLVLANGDELPAERMAWSSTLGDLLRATGHAERARQYAKCSIALVFAHVSKSNLRRNDTIASIADPEMKVFRVTNQSACSGDNKEIASLVIEVNPDYAGLAGTDAPSALAELVRTELLALGWVAKPDHVEVAGVKILANALMLPTLGNLDAHAAEEAAADEIVPNVRRLGPASGFFTSSLNDQIVQGLKISAEQGIPH